ncbi:hypothetical protein SASPL_118918 [Salvia splendens]|uniref:Aquaporin TIP n=1 Tax=Salvia splendens TaxID=180675 RepID=A0A8X8XYL7_SALSN|nr:probable aquaporin TIP5-1 [Salvia splendens]KAG6422350.1 hypothetical protein SASPL_118918 [Salvia splendens]
MSSLKSRLQHCFTPLSLRCYLAEFISTFLFVFASVGAATASWKMTPAAATDPASLTATAVASAFALSAAIYMAADISGGHVNPAVTFGMAVGGHITIPMAVFYSIAQLLGSVMSCLLLKTMTVGQQIRVHRIPDEMTGFGASVLEGVMTFGLVYTVYASRRGGVVGPLAVGFMLGANVLASGPFTGGSMNPARAFGAAVVGGSFRNQAVYWVGPLMGAALAGVLYDNVVFPVPVSEAVVDI